jgi:hypothetical protein
MAYKAKSPNKALEMQKFPLPILREEVEEIMTMHPSKRLRQRKVHSADPKKPRATTKGASHEQI